MAQRSITADLLEALEPWLDAQMAKWLAQPEASRSPTLPVTVENKVNVREITKALGLAQSKEQHFFKKPELRSAINAAAERQGLLSIGSRVQMEAAEQAVVDRMDRIQRGAADLSRQLAEREALIERQRAEITALKEQLRLRSETGMILRISPLSGVNEDDS